MCVKQGNQICVSYKTNGSAIHRISAGRAHAARSHRPAERSPSSWVECAACSSRHNHFLFSLEARLRGPILHEKRGGFICSHFPIHLRLGSVARVQALPRLDPGCTAPARRGAVPAKRPPRRLFPGGPGRAPPLCANPSHLHLTTIKTFRSLRRFLPLIIT